MAKFTRADVRRILGDAHTEELENQLIALHLGVVDPLKDQIAAFKNDSDRLATVQKELDDLKAAGDGGYKKRYEDEHAAFEAYKGDIVAKETRTAKEKAVRAYYESKGIKGNNLEIAMKGSSAEIDGIDLDGTNIKDAAALDSLIGGTFSGLVSNGPSFNWSAPVGEGSKPNNANAAMNALIRGATK